MNYLVAVDDWFLDSPGGMARVAWDVALIMRRQGHHVALLCAKPPSKPEAAESEQAEGIQVVRYERPVLPGWHPRRADRLIESAASAARKYLQGCDWDTIHIHSPLTGGGVVDGLGSGPRLVYTVHSPLVLEQRINWNSQGLVGKLKLAVGQGRLKQIEGGLLRRCDAIQTLSQFTREQLKTLYGVGLPITVIPHWRRPELRREHSRQEARRLLAGRKMTPILFTVRHLGARNGVDIGIRSVAPFAVSGRCRFMIAGGGMLRSQLESLSRELGTSDRIGFLGRIPDQQLQLAYEAADLFLLPTLSLECFGLILLEAFSFGCPVLSTDAGAIPEIMSAIMPGFIVPAGDQAALSSKLADFLEGRLIAPAPDELVSYVRERFDPEVVQPMIFELLGQFSAAA